MANIIIIDVLTRALYCYIWKCAQENVCKDEITRRGDEKQKYIS